MNRIDKIMLAATPKKRKEILNKIFDKLYQRALRLKKFNYCQIKCGSCVAARLNKDNKIQKIITNRNDKFNGCCNGCRYLGKNGCTVEALSCRAWYCGILVVENNWREENPYIYVALRRLNNAISRWGLESHRKAKEETIAARLKDWCWVSRQPKSYIDKYI